MEDIGSMLRHARQQQSKSLQDIHEETRVNIEHLRSLEQNDFTFLPETYVKSFLKTYAGTLGLDVDEVLARYQSQQPSETPVQIEQATSEDEVIADDSVTEPARRFAADFQQAQRRLLEYGLGIGAVLLLLSLILAYVQYRSQIYARPVDELTYRRSEERIDMAHIQVGTPTREAAGIAPMEFAVQAQDHIAVRLTLDGKPVVETILQADERKVWLANSRIDVELRRVEKRQKRLTSAVEDSTANVVKMSFVKQNLDD